MGSHLQQLTPQGMFIKHAGEGGEPQLSSLCTK